jgi:DNA-binding transcriptional LysR family regulator
MDVLRAMHAFRAVVATGSFAGAAKTLGITTAWTSKQVSMLEQHLNAQLINRSTRRLSITDLGRVYLARCDSILADLEDAENSLGVLQASPRGRMRMTVPMSFGLLRVAPLLAAFCRRYPDVELDVAFNDRVADLLNEDFDLAIRIAARLDDSTLSVRKLSSGKRVVCASPDYLRARGTPEHPTDLERHACLRYALHAAPGTWELMGPGGPITIRTSGPLQVNNSLAIRDALLGGLGIAIVPDFIVAAELESGRLQPLLSDYPPSGYGIFAVSPPSRYATPKARVLIDFLAEQLKAPSPAP